MDVRRQWPIARGDMDAGDMDAGEEARVADAHVEEAWLLGQPSLQGFLDYVEDHCIDWRAMSRAEWVDEWRAANDHYHDLETTESGAADAIRVRELGGAYADLVAEVRADPRFARAFDKLPTRFAMVELDRLVVCQSHIDLEHAARLKARAGKRPSKEALFRFCQPLGGFEAPVRVRKAGERRYLFSSESSDLRFQESLLLRLADFVDHRVCGSLGGAVGLFVGFGPNFLTAVQSDDRLLLRNGHHRAYALRAMGVRHAPCIVQTVTRGEELSLLASSKVMASPGFYLRAARPPLLKDFFDPRIRKMLRVRRTEQVVELAIEVKDYQLRPCEAARERP